jgi:hypothetical protein
MNRKDKNNLRFFLMRRTLERASGKLNAGVQDLVDLDFKKVTPNLLERCLEEIFDEYVKRGASDQVAKGPELEKFVNETAL